MVHLKYGRTLFDFVAHLIPKLLVQNIWLK